MTLFSHGPPRWLRDLIEFVKAFGVILGFIVGVVVVVVVYFDDLAKLWDTATLNQKIAAAIVLTIAWASGIICYIVFRHGVPHYFARLGMTAAIREASRRLREYMAECLHDSEPRFKWHGGIPRKGRSVWRHLAASFVDAYSEECTKLRDHGLQGRPLLASNFQVYAKCVAALLRNIKGKKGTVWTLLRRPIPEWYNLFPVLLDPSNSNSRGVFTTRWWEGYKKDIRSLCDPNLSKVTLKRLIAIPPGASSVFQRYRTAADANASRLCCVYDQADAFDLKSGIGLSTDGVTLLPEIRVMLDASHNSLPDRARIHLVGTFSGERSPLPWIEIVEHFERTFHTAAGNHRNADDPDVGGVYYRYLTTVPRIFADFDDIFLIDVEDMLFGIALCVEEDLDKGGISILRPENREFIDAFEAAWGEGSNHLTLKYFENELMYIVSNP